MIRDAAEFSFSWSYRRQEFWNECRRSCFLAYYGCRGGHDPDSGPSLRRLHEMRSLLTAETYFRKLIADGMRETFYRAHEEEHPEYSAETLPLAGKILGRFRREFRRMLSGEWRNDHCSPMLVELYNQLLPPGELASQLERRIRTALESLESGAWPMLDGIPFHSRRAIDSPLAVNIAELCCFAAPVLAFQEQGLFTIVEFSGADSTVLLHKYHALNARHISPERVRSLELDPDSGALRAAGEELNISRTLREVRNGAMEMLNAIRPDGTVREEDFPASGRNCDCCRFAQYCHSHGA